MASNELLKKIAAVIEIFIIYSIFIWLAIRAYSKHKVADIKKNWIKHRQNPLILPFSSLFGKNPSEVLQGLVGQNIKHLFQKTKEFFYHIFGTFNKIFGFFRKTVDEIRNLTKPIRLFFKKATQMFYKKLSNVMIGVSYTMHKIRNALRRSVSGFNMAFHTLNAIQLTLRAVMNSPMVGIVKEFLPVLDWIGGALGTLGFCFSGDTYINTINGKTKIKYITPGEILLNNNKVICVHKFINNDDMYLYKNICVSGSHLVNENNKWIRVKDSKYSNKTDFNEKHIYCLTTTKGIININNILFKDFSESQCEKVNRQINDIILKKLNGTEQVVNKKKHKYIEQGIGELTEITLKNNNKKMIKDLNIGDETKMGKIIGLIKIDPSLLTVYMYKNKYIMSGNVKVNENDLWINVSDSIYSEKIKNYDKILYHMVVENEKINLNDIIICDYLECHDDYTNEEIDELVNKFCNK